VSKTVAFDSLPPEIGTVLSGIDSPECFSIEGFRHEAITVVNKRLSRVYKFVRRNKKLVLQLDKEVNNLILLGKRKIQAPTVLDRQVLKQYEMVSYSYIEGEIVEGKTVPTHAKLLAEAHRNLHLTFARFGRSEVAEWNSARMLKPIFSKANATEYAPELVRYARSIARELKVHELAREDVTFIHSDSHLILYEKKSIQRDLILAYLNEYFESSQLTERDVQLIDLHTKLRFLEGATWHLLESKEDQILNKVEYAKFVEESWRKAERFDLAKILGTRPTK
jgi:hypothetical protein